MSKSRLITVAMAVAAVALLNRIPQTKAIING
ncbi:hypothetical protein HNR64_003330 [Spongiibacter marinus]|nr:hypothetical protein [Spongiibacter marinus]